MKIPQITLRPHHFLCLKGYKGLNYNNTQIGIWNSISTILKEKPNTLITIGEGKDSLCKTCPSSTQHSNGFFICFEANIKKLDKKVSQILGLKTGERIRYSTVTKRLKETFTKEKHEELCSKCFWWQKGLCQDSFISTNK